MPTSRQKGIDGEMQLAQWIFMKKLVQKVPKRNLEQVRTGGIDLVPEDHPFAYEVKNVKNLTGNTFDKWWIKACKDARKEKREPVVAFKTPRGDWMFLISVEELLGLPGSYAIVRSLTFVKYAQKRIAGYGGG